ncbi:hypothetical protein [Sphingomonas sp. dw_22]|uniref:hypothetical protein n=1 Tax=Sphingomonas sp. dw_22 TaxID=2721175 RepID=UPI001BD1EE39|nr:hypothetical protein [Sphingomonas sp. dw_22]
MGYEADVEGCYVCWSPTLAKAYRKRFTSMEHTIVKIGRSVDIYDRHRNHCGEDSEASRGRWAVDRDGYAHVKDWILWRITTNPSGEPLHALERRLHLKHSPLARFIWDSIHDEVSCREFTPDCQELFIARINKIERDFPLLINEVEW